MGTPLSLEVMRSRYRGALLGLAAGDALGAALEFAPPGTFPPITDMVGGGPFRLRPGYWTDDTSMALCLAESLIECRGFDPVDQLRRYLRWYREGYRSSIGVCFDIGNTVRKALERFERTGELYCGPTDLMSAGNGALMRLAPVPLFYAARPLEAIERAGESGRTTHDHSAAIDACRYFAALLLGALRGLSKEELLSPRYTPVPGYWDSRPLVPEIDQVAQALSNGKNLRRSGPPGMWWPRWRRPCGRSRARIPLRKAPCGRSIWERMRTRWVRFTGSWPAPSMAWRRSRRPGGLAWRCGRRSKSWQISCSSWRGAKGAMRSLLKRTSRMLESMDRERRADLTPGDDP